MGCDMYCGHGRLDNPAPELPMYVGASIEGQRSPFSVTPSPEETRRWKAAILAAKQERESAANE
jgi:hypothetical protein